MAELKIKRLREARIYRGEELQLDLGKRRLEVLKIHAAVAGKTVELFTLIPQDVDPLYYRALLGAVELAIDATAEAFAA